MANQQQLILKIRGLYTSPNDLSSVPEGSQNIADDVSLDFESIAQPRRGFESLTYAFANTNDRANRLIEYQSQLIAHHGTSNVSWYDTGSGWTSLSTTIGNPDDDLARVRFVSANNNLYMTSDTGIFKQDAYTVTPFLAGAPKALDGNGTTTGASGFLDNLYSTAYRVVWGYRDLTNNLILGSPSQRIVVANTSGGTRNVSLNFSIPQVVTTAFFYQVYRAAQVLTANGEPSDEMNLVYEANPSSGEITAKQITFTDSVPESLRSGATLYTSPSQEGILASNDPPPFAWDMVNFRGSMIYLNTIGKQNRTVNILAVGGASGIQLNDTLTVGGITLTAKNAENASLGEYQLFTGGTPSQNITDTANSLVRVANRYATNTVFYCYYTSGVNDLPGRILFEERGYGASAFAFTVSANGAAFNPTLPTSGTSIVSTNDVYQNGVYFSKTNQPEAVPITSFQLVGDASKRCLRGLALRDSVLIFKEDGIFRITGTTPSDFVISALDSSTNLLAPDSAVVLGDQVYCLADQGVVAVSDVGTQVKSRPIEDILLELYGVALDTVKYQSSGVSYESDRKYILFLPDSGSTVPVQAYVYHQFTNAWGRWRREETCGYVRPTNNKLYVGNSDSNTVSIERKSYSLRDYADEGTTNSIVSFTGTTVVLGSVTGVQVGDVVYQSNTSYSTILSVDTNTISVVVEDEVTWSIGACSILAAFESDLQWNVAVAGNPGALKQFPESLLAFRTARFNTGRVSYKTELSNAYEDVSFDGAPTSAWGQFPWGDGAWGGVVVSFPVRLGLPSEKQICSQLTIRLRIRFGFGNWKLDGISLPYSFISTAVTK